MKYIISILKTDMIGIIDCGCALGDEGGCLGCLAIDEKTGEIVDIYYEK